MTISLNVSKGETISLAEKAPNLTKAIAAAGWDQAQSGKTIDVDLFAVLLGQDGKPLNVLSRSIMYNPAYFLGLRQ